MYSVEEFDREKTKILKYIMYKKRTENEVRNKFKLTIEENLLEDIIDYLKETRYINDYNYIERFVSECMALKNLSIKELKYKLYSKGINRNLLDEYIQNNYEELEEYERKSAENIKTKKQNIMNEEEIKIYLLKKGYKGDNI